MSSFLSSPSCHSIQSTWMGKVTRPAPTRFNTSHMRSVATMDAARTSTSSCTTGEREHGMRRRECKHKMKVQPTSLLAQMGVLESMVAVRDAATTRREGTQVSASSSRMEGREGGREGRT